MNSLALQLINDYSAQQYRPNLTSPIVIQK